VTNKEDFLESKNARLRALLRQAGLDAAESDVAHELRRLLLSEMHHRIKNVLAMVQSIVVQSLRSAPTPADATEAITYRIAALARTQDIIMSTAGEGPATAHRSAAGFVVVNEKSAVCASTASRPKKWALWPMARARDLW